MSHAEHALAAAVVDDRTFQGDDPGTLGSDGDVWIDRVRGVKIDVAVLNAPRLFRLVQAHEVRELRRDPAEFSVGTVDRDHQGRVDCQEFQDDIIGQPCRLDASAAGGAKVVQTGKVLAGKIGRAHV